MADELYNDEISREPVHIPLEVVREILAYLDYQSLNKVTYVCKHLKGIVDQGNYWNHLCLHDFNINADSFNNLHPKELYKISLKNYCDTKNYHMRGYKSNITCPAQYFLALLPSQQSQLISVSV